jgi:hypothetical protein
MRDTAADIALVRLRSRVTPFTESSAHVVLDTLEARMKGEPHQILGIPADASVADACLAFATLAKVYHPRRFHQVSAVQAVRAHCLYQQLRLALHRHVASK